VIVKRFAFLLMVIRMNILFVCSANIVRSFMAEAVMTEKLRKKGRRDIAVSSAALMDMNGQPADPLAVKILKENGIESEGHLSRALTDAMFADADLVVVMEEIQKRLLIERYPEAEDKIRLLKSFSKGYIETDADIKDPYRLTIYHYRLCFSEISTAVGALTAAL
jgi:protein-tyrosine phosphatase